MLSSCGGHQKPTERERYATAESDLQYFNSQLREFYRMNAVDQSAALRNNATIAKYEAAADGLRDLIYGSTYCR